MTFEGQEFVLERLFRGSVINYRTFFMEQSAITNMRFATNSTMLQLPYVTMQKILKRNYHLEKSFSTYRIKLLKLGKAVPLDFIIELPRNVQAVLTEKAKQRMLRHNQDLISNNLNQRKREYRKVGL